MGAMLSDINTFATMETTIWGGYSCTINALVTLAKKGPATLHDFTQLNSLVELSWGQPYSACGILDFHDNWAGS